MQLHQFTGAASPLLAFDIFDLLDLQKWDQASKQEYLDKVNHLTIVYFFQEKIADNLTKAQAESIMKKYPLETLGQNLDAFFEELGEILPNAADLFIEATLEIKARLVRDQYKNKMDNLEKIKKSSKNKKEIKLVEQQIKACEKSLNFVDNEDWAELLLHLDKERAKLLKGIE